MPETAQVFHVSPEHMVTDEEEWLDALGRRDLAAFDEPAPKRIVVVAPHPDDEVLGVGGLVREWARAGTEVCVVAVTDGERSDPAAGTLARRWLGRRRRGETRRGLGRLGVAVDIHRLGIGDGAVKARSEVVRNAVDRLSGPESCCAVTWCGDGHPDHEASGRAAADACRDSGARLLEYPVWMWHWAEPEDPRVPWDRARAVFLDGPTLLAKRAALREYRSQVRTRHAGFGRPRMDPALPPPVLDRFRRPFEVVFT